MIKIKQDDLEKQLETKSTESSKTTFPDPSQPNNRSNILKESPAHCDIDMTTSLLRIPLCQVLVIKDLCQMNPH